MVKTLAMAAALVSLAAVALLAAWSASSGTDTASAQTAVDIGIDMDVTGNDARTVGTVENCGEIDSTGTNTIDLDIVIPSPGVDSADGLKGYELDLLYDPTVVTVTAEDKNSYLLNQAAGSTPLSLSDTVPDVDGNFGSSVADIGSPPDPEPTGISEVGPGVLVRITLTGVAPGTSSLIIDSNPSKLVLGDAAGNPIPINQISHATVSVDEPCFHQPPGPDVRIAGLVCDRDPEIVRIKNFGTEAQNLTGWELRSDAADTPFDLSVVGSLAPGEDTFVWGVSGAAVAAGTDGIEFWDTNEKFRNDDSSDFAQVVDDGDTQIDKENCVLGDMLEDVVGGFNGTLPEDGVFTCSDGMDNGGGDGADDADASADCMIYDSALVEPQSCGDTLDNGLDGVADTDDEDCHTDGNAANPGSYDPTLDEDDGARTCADSTDNDGDTLVDSLDSDCTRYEPEDLFGVVIEDGVGTCDDGEDNGGGDGADRSDTDCADFLSTDGLPGFDLSPGPSEDDPVETTVRSSGKGLVRILETDFTQSPPSGLVFLGREVSVEAPAATADEPLSMSFALYSGIIPEGSDETSVQLFKDGVQVEDCTGAAGTASPDPCVSKRQAVGSGDVRITVLSSTDGVWDLGAPPAPTPTPPAGTTPTATATGTPTGTPSGTAVAPPPTGDDIPINEGGSSGLAWLLVGLGTAIVVVATGYVVLARKRGHSPH